MFARQLLDFGYAFIVVCLASALSYMYNKIHNTAKATWTTAEGSSCDTLSDALDTFESWFLLTNSVPLRGLPASSSTTKFDSKNSQQLQTMSMTAALLVIYGSLFYFQQSNQLDRELALPASPLDDNWIGPLHASIRDDSPMLVSFFAHKNKKKAWVVFRGSQTKYDWINVDFNIRQTAVVLKTPSGDKRHVQLHSGYYSTFTLIQPKLKAWIDKYLDMSNASDVEISFAGHSLGAAMANLTSAIYATETNCAVSVFAFAPPRAGNKAFASLFLQSQSQSKQPKSSATNVISGLQFINTQDVVPTAPAAITANVSCPSVPFYYWHPLMTPPNGTYRFTTPGDTLGETHSMVAYYNSLLCSNGSFVKNINETNVTGQDHIQEIVQNSITAKQRKYALGAVHR